MMANRSLLLFLLFGISISPQVLAADTFRILGGLGLTQTSLDYEEMELLKSNYGGQFLHYVAERYAYGLEIVHHKMFKSKEAAYEYLSVCIVLEAKPYKIWLNQMGIAGYIGTGDNRLKPFGFRASTGLEIPIKGEISLPILLRNEIIFEEETILSFSLETGVGVRF